MENNIIKMTTLELRTAAPFSTLFPIRDQVLEEIAADMKKNGYDYAHPVVLWAGHKATVVDGHTRLRAALKIGMTKVPVTLKEFADEDEALRYAIKSQSSRRNLSDAELLACIAELDKRHKTGPASKESLATHVANSGKSAQNTADLLGVNRGKVEKLRTVQDHAPEEIKNAVATGGMSVNRAYNETMKQRNKEINMPEEEKPRRMAAIIKTIVNSAASRIEREIQEYPEIEYRNVDKEKIKQEIFGAIGEYIDSLPRTTNEE